MLKIIGALAWGYLIGSFQTAYLVGKIFTGQDIRELGNKNAGASNTSISLGWGYGLLVALVDMGKAFLAVSLIGRLRFFQGDSAYLYYAGLASILGHNYPFYLDFKGGKGTACLLGMILAINLRFGILALVWIFLVTLGTGYIALGTLSLATNFFVQTMIRYFLSQQLLIVTIICGLSFYKHRENLKNIEDGSEISLADSIKKFKRESR